MTAGLTTANAACIRNSENSFTNSPASIALEQTYSGAHTFLRMPRTARADGAQFAVMGVPFDLATSNRSGARLGPDAVRAASALLAELKAYPGGYDPLAHVVTADVGNVSLDYGFPHSIPDAIAAAAFEVIETGAFLLTLGGDHFISYPLLKAHARKFGPLALIHFDAHTDTWSPRRGPNGEPELNHGTMFALAIEEGLIDPARSVQIGIRTWVDDPMGVNMFDMAWVEENGIAALVKAVRAIVGTSASYMTVDIDALDPAYAPGTGTPVTGGLTPRELLAAIRGLDNLNIVGADVVEVAPAYDPSGITALNAATVAYEHLARIARANGAKAQAYPQPRVGLVNARSAREI